MIPGADIITPQALKEGDKIAILSPATIVNPDYIDGACKWIANQGWQPIVMPSAKGPAHGSYASTISNRLADLQTAIYDPEIKAILCARGGYGTVHLLDRLKAEALKTYPKWLIGFSDISALHALMWHHNIKSIHASMAKHLTEFPDDIASRQLASILKGDNHLEVSFNSEPGNIAGRAMGILRGGNLAVLDGLAATRFDMLNVKKDEQIILFLEDIAEPIYKVERILWRLYLSGTLHNIKGLIFGHFTDYKPDRNFNTIEEMITSNLKNWGLNTAGHHIPIVFKYPCGHFAGNLPLVEGATAELDVNPTKTTLIQHF